MIELPWTKDDLLAAPAALFRHPRPVRLQDCDAAGIVFFARFFEYFHDALMAGLEAGGYSVPRLLREGKLLVPIREAQAEYLAPLCFGDRVVVEVVRTAAGESAAWIGYRIGGESGRVHAVGRTLHLCLERETLARVAWPPDLLECLTSFGGQAGRPAD